MDAAVAPGGREDAALYAGPSSTTPSSGLQEIQNDTEWSFSFNFDTDADDANAFFAAFS